MSDDTKEDIYAGQLRTKGMANFRENAPRMEHVVRAVDRPVSSPGIKKDDGKPPVDLIDPNFILGIGRVLGKGAVKYAVDNWKHGMAIGKVLAGVMRHILSRAMGEVYDPETGEMHMHHAACGCMFVAYYDFHGLDHVPDDRFKKVTP